MSEANVDLVKRMYDAFGRGEIGTIIRAVTPDARWAINGRQSDFPTLGTRNGRTGVQDFFTSVGEHLDFSEFSPREFHAVGDKVFVIGYYAMTVKKTRRSFSSEWCHIFTVRDGKIAEFREFTDTAQAAEAYRD